MDLKMILEKNCLKVLKNNLKLYLNNNNYKFNCFG
jgi:hypothetical protein